jgi:hypothetical protein
MLLEFLITTRTMGLSNLSTRFRSMFSTWFSKSRPPKTTEYVIQGGSVARFAFQKRDLFADGSPKPKLFMPETHPELGRFETSVCGLNGVGWDRIWFLGNTIRSPMPAVAAAELTVAGVTRAEAGLRCEAAPEPDYPEHGVIIGWDEDKDSKHHRLMACQELVAAVSAVHRP